MEKSSTGVAANNGKITPDQVQAIYLAQANIFYFEASQPKSWVPLCDSTVPISILYDNTRSIYRIISVDADIKEVIVNTTVIPDLEFVKTTSKFGYWKDVASGRIFGIGFASEYEAEAFDECLKKVKQNIGPPSVNSCMNLNSPETSTTKVDNKHLTGGSVSNASNKLHQQRPHRPTYHGDGLHGEGDGPMKFPPITGSSSKAGSHGLESPGRRKKLNWEDIEQLGPAVLSFLNTNRHQQNGTMKSSNHANEHRPSTYKVDLPVIGTAPPTAAPQPRVFSGNVEDVRPTQPFHHPFHQYYNPQLARHIPVTPAPLPIDNSMMSLTMPLPQGYCYQGPPSLAQAPSSDNAGGSVTPRGNAPNERRDLLDEINRIKAENIKLSESLIESTCHAKKWELQMNAVRADNLQLVKNVSDLNSKIEAVHSECRETKEQASRWKDHYQQAVASTKEKCQQLKDLEDKLKSAASDKIRAESVMKDLEEELKKQQQINREQLCVTSNHAAAGQYNNKYFKELEDHYRKLLADSQKRVEELLRKDGDRKNVLRGVDTLFTGAIQGLINIHGQIRQAYEQ